MDYTKKDYCTPIIYKGIDPDRYGIYKDGTIINFETKYELKPYIWRGDKTVRLYGFDKCFTFSVMKLLALVYIKKTDEDIKRKRTSVRLIDPDKKVCVDNIIWTNKLELMITKELHKNQELQPSDYVIPICKLLEKDYSVDEICRVLNFNNKLYVHNIKNRRIYKDISKKYKW